MTEWEADLINKGYIRWCAAALFLVALLTAAALPVLAAGEGTDLSRPASSHNATVSSADIVEYFIGEGITDAERKYLEKHGGVSLKFDKGITTSYVNAEYCDGSVTVRAVEYTYTAADGTAVSWIPKALSVGGKSTDFTLGSGDYLATVSGLTEDDSLTATVTYTLDISVSTETVNRLVNLAYNDVSAIRAEIEAGYAEYDRLLREYEAGVIAYDEYLALMAQYELDFAAYTDYLSKKKIYDDAKEEYEAYLADLDEYRAALRAEEEYNAALAEYNSALEAYNNYVSELDVYNARLAEYNDYLEKMAVVDAQLAALDAFWLPMTDGRTAEGAINGSLVTEVLEGNRDLFEGNTFKVDACLIDDAGEATRELRILLSDYRKNTDKISKYQFYISNHEAFRSYTVLLLQSLDELYNYDKVRSGINLKNTTYPRKYEILVAQLAVIANALNDGPVYSYWAAYHDTKCTTAGCTLSSHAKNRYVINESTAIHKNTVSQMLEGKTYLADTENASPLSGGVPIEVAEPTAPEVKEKPTKPVAPTVPAKPTEAQNPGEAPTPVTEPTRPTEPEVPTEPTEYIPEAEKSAVLELYDSGRLSRREEVTGECVYTATATVEKKLFGAYTVTVFFYSEGGELLYATAVDGGTRADFIGNIPTKNEDDRATYTFSHWVDSDGNAADLSAVTHDLVLYPSFSEHIKSYGITFNIDGKETVVNTPCGEIPVFDGTPTRMDDEYSEFTFAGWDRELSSVTGETTYYATFTSKYILPLNTGGAKITDDGTNILVECADPFTRELDLSGVIARATEGKVRGAVIDTRIFDLTLSYATLLEMKAAGDTTLRLELAKRGEYTYFCSVNAGEGDYRMRVSLPCTFENGRQLRLYHTADGERTNVLYVKTADTVEFTLTTKIRYTVSEEYDLGVISNPLVTLAPLANNVARGATVRLDLTVPNGIMLDRLYLVYPDGTEEDITGDSFVMPASDVTVCVKASYIEYLITFVSADKTIVTYKHRYGDTVTPPPDPTRPSDGEYRYYFASWSGKFTPVTENRTYYAQYERVPIPPKEEPDGLRISDSVLGLIVAAVAFVSMMLLAVIPASVCAIVLGVRERKLYLRKPKKTDGEGDNTDK